jgi:hypothetical protein
MINRAAAPQVLSEKGNAIIKAAGNSMQPIMTTGDTLYLKKVDPSKLRKGDAVFCKINGNKFVHLITGVDSKGSRFQISNNRGHVNGWIGPSGIYGLCVRVNDRILVSDDELESR